MTVKHSNLQQNMYTGVSSAVVAVGRRSGRARLSRLRLLVLRCGQRLLKRTSIRDEVATLVVSSWSALLLPDDVVDVPLRRLLEDGGHLLQGSSGCLGEEEVR